MSKEDRLILDYMAMLGHLGADLKLRLISELSASLRSDAELSYAGSEEGWRALFGAWADTGDDMANFVRNTRFPNREVPGFE